MDASGDVVVNGIAWDGGHGITSVAVSINGGMTFEQAHLGQDLGRYSFRPWSYRFRPKEAGALSIMVQATNAIGQSQTGQIIPNPAGYHHNVMHRVTVQVG